MYDNIYDDLLRAMVERPKLIGEIFGTTVINDPYVDYKVLGNEALNACVLSSMPGIVFVNRKWMQAHVRVQRAVIAHEVGHIVNGDLHGDQRLAGRDTEREIAADKVAVKMCGKEAVLSYLYEIRNTNIQYRKKNNTSWSKTSKDFRMSLLELTKRIDAITLTPEVTNG